MSELGNRMAPDIQTLSRVRPVRHRAAGRTEVVVQAAPPKEQQLRVRLAARAEIERRHVDIGRRRVDIEWRHVDLERRHRDVTAHARSCAAESGALLCRRTQDFLPLRLEDRRRRAGRGVGLREAVGERRVGRRLCRRQLMRRGIGASGRRRALCAHARIGAEPRRLHHPLLVCSCRPGGFADAACDRLERQPMRRGARARRVQRDAVVVAIQRTHEVGIYKGLDVLGAHPDLAGPERKIPDRGVDASCASSTNRLDKCMR
mmetsp:Transcript_46046/g.148337  ORF Transcript_46046/g.148337 Transcript_46046/m.148337 type:complete len:261 (+) Transcript_46046:44-826(+)